MSGDWSSPDGGGLVPASIDDALDRYRTTVSRLVAGRVEAVYAVGAIALGDWSERHSNIDLVVVSTPGLSGAEREQLAGAEKALEHGGRRPGLWYATWDEIAGETAAALPADRRPDAGPAGRPPTDDDLATPLTLGILRQDPVAVEGPDWPVVGFDPDALRRWALGRLRALVESSHGLLVMRRDVVPMVLEAARLAQAVTTGRVISKSAAGEAMIPLVATPYRRILTDSVGYRQGARTSMYWGPFERKYDALALLRELLGLASGS